MSASWDPKLARLAQLPLFAGCDRRQLRAIGRLGDVVTRDRGTVLTDQGRWGREAFVIVDGSATVSRDGVALGTLGPGDVAGAVAVLDGGRRTVTAIADTPVELLVFDPRAFKSLLALSPHVTRRVLASTASRLRTAYEQPTAPSSVTTPANPQLPRRRPLEASTA